MRTHTQVDILLVLSLSLARSLARSHYHTCTTGRMKPSTQPPTHTHTHTHTRTHTHTHTALLCLRSLTECTAHQIYLSKHSSRNIHLSGVPQHFSVFSVLRRTLSMNIVEQSVFGTKDSRTTYPCHFHHNRGGMCGLTVASCVEPQCNTGLRYFFHRTVLFCQCDDYSRTPVAHTLLFLHSVIITCRILCGVLKLVMLLANYNQQLSNCKKNLSSQAQFEL